MTVLLEAAFAHHSAGRAVQAEALYRQLLAEDADDLNGLQLLGALLQDMARPQEAAIYLRRAVGRLEPNGPADPQHAALYYNFANTLQSLGDAGGALAFYRQALQLAPDFPAFRNALARAALPGARAALRAGQAADGAARLAELEALHATEPDLLFELGLLLCEAGEPARAEKILLGLLAIAENHVGVRCALGNACRALDRLEEASDWYQAHLDQAPGSAIARYRLGHTLTLLGRETVALPHLAQATMLGDRDVAYLAHVELGHLHLAAGRTPEGEAHFRAALRIKPLATQPGPRDVAGPAALFVMRPGGNNTPYDYLITDAPFTAHILFLLPDTRYDIAALAAQSDVVVNLISDVDHDGALLADVAILAAALGRPVINPPARIAPTDRVAVARTLAAIPSCRVATITAHTGRALRQPGALATRRTPVLARRAGCHGGDDFELVRDEAELQRLVAQDDDSAWFLIDYIDTQSADGFFRKYRFFIVGDAVLPYHLAIGAEWKVHHYSTDMANQPWMRQEEEAFLRAPETVFSPENFAALHAIRQAIGLDYFGIDCARDRAGRLVVFEANATMLAHEDTGDFAYKNPTVRRIKQEFAALVTARASRPFASQVARHRVDH